MNAASNQSSRFSQPQRAQLAAAPASSRRSLRRKFLQDNNGKRFPVTAQPAPPAKPQPKAKARTRRMGMGRPLVQSGLTLVEGGSLSPALMPAFVSGTPTRTFLQTCRCDLNMQQQSNSSATTLGNQGFVFITPLCWGNSTGDLAAVLFDTNAVPTSGVFYPGGISSLPLSGLSTTSIMSPNICAYPLAMFQPSVVGAITGYGGGRFRVVLEEVRLTITTGGASMARMVVDPVDPSDSMKTTQTLISTYRTDAFLPSYTIQGTRQISFHLPVPTSNALGVWRGPGLDTQIGPGPNDGSVPHAGLAIAFSWLGLSSTDMNPCLSIEVARVLQVELATGFEDLSNPRDTIPVSIADAQRAADSAPNSGVGASGAFFATNTTKTVTATTAKATTAAAGLIAGAAAAIAQEQFARGEL